MTEELEKLCHKAMESIAESNKKLEKDGERLNTSDAEYLAYLVKIVKSCKTIEAMEEYDDGYSGTYGDGYSGARYRRTMETRPMYRRY
jgi:hypothetical protein